MCPHLEQHKTDQGISYVQVAQALVGSDTRGPVPLPADVQWLLLPLPQGSGHPFLTFTSQNPALGGGFSSCCPGVW